MIFLLDDPNNLLSLVDSEDEQDEKVVFGPPTQKDSSSILMKFAIFQQAEDSADGLIQLLKINLGTSMNTGAAMKTRKNICRILVNRGVLLERTGKFEMALETYLQAKTFDPYSLSVEFGIGTLKLYLGDIQEGMKRLGRVRAVCPSHISARINLSVGHLYGDNTKEARVLLNEIQKEAPENGHAYTNMAVALAIDGEHALATEQYTSSITRLASHAPLYVHRGRMMAKGKRMHESMIDFATAAYIDPAINF